MRRNLILKKMEEMVEMKQVLFTILILVVVILFVGCAGGQVNGGGNPTFGSPTIQLISPINNAVNVSTNPNLNWQAQVGAQQINSRIVISGYQLYFATQTGDYSSPIELVNSNYQILNLNYNTTYKWKVVAIQSDLKMATSTEFQFTTAGQGVIPNPEYSYDECFKNAFDSGVVGRNNIFNQLAAGQVIYLRYSSGKFGYLKIESFDEINQLLGLVNYVIYDSGLLLLNKRRQLELGKSYDLDEDGISDINVISELNLNQQRSLSERFEEVNVEPRELVNGFYLSFVNEAKYSLLNDSDNGLIKILNNGTLIFNAEKLIVIGSSSTDTVIYEKTESFPQLKIGDVLVDHQNRVLRKITNVVDGVDQIAIQNERATINDLFDELYLNLEITPDLLGISNPKDERYVLDLDVDYDLDVSELYSGAEGQININDDLSSYVYIFTDSNRFEIDVRSINSGRVDLSLDFTNPVTVQSTFLIPDIESSFTYLVDYLPIEVDVHLEGQLDLDVEAGSSFDLGFSSEGYLESGIYYNNYGNQEWIYRNWDIFDSQIIDDFSINQKNAEVKFSYKPVLDFKIGYMQGPKFGFSPEIEANSVVSDSASNATTRGASQVLVESSFGADCEVDFVSNDFFNFFNLPATSNHHWI